MNIYVQPRFDGVMSDDGETIVFRIHPILKDAWTPPTPETERIVHEACEPIIAMASQERDSFRSQWESTYQGPQDAVRVEVNRTCNRCLGPIGRDSGPPDGWTLENGEVVCHACCVNYTKQIVERVMVVGTLLDDLFPQADCVVRVQLDSGRIVSAGNQGGWYGCFAGHKGSKCVICGNDTKGWNVEEVEVLPVSIKGDST